MGIGNQFSVSASDLLGLDDLARIVLQFKVDLPRRLAVLHRFVRVKSHRRR